MWCIKYILQTPKHFPGKTISGPTSSLQNANYIHQVTWNCWTALIYICVHGKHRKLNLSTAGLEKISLGRRLFLVKILWFLSFMLYMDRSLLAWNYRIHFFPLRKSIVKSSWVKLVILKNKMKTGRNRFLRINRGLKNSFSFEWKQQCRHRELNFSKWNQNLKSSCVQSRLPNHSRLFQLPPHFPATAVFTYCLFSLIRHPSHKLFIIPVHYSLIFTATGHEV